MKRIIGACIAVCCALFLGGCGEMMKSKPASDAAIVKFHQQFDAGEFDQIWDSAHEGFRKGTKKEKYLEFMAAVHRKLGKVKTSTGAGWNVRSFNLTTTVTTQQKTTFEMGEGTESFVFEMSGDRALLYGYRINSMELITK